jgi:hypothetical protein
MKEAELRIVYRGKCRTTAFLEAKLPGSNWTSIGKLRLNEYGQRKQADWILNYWTQILFGHHGKKLNKEMMQE